MNAGPFASLIADFAQNWATHRPALSVSLAGAELEVDQDHPLHGELFALCSGRSASLPFFPPTGDVVWCTVAPNSDSLRHAVAALGAWAIPSFGGTASGDGYVRPGTVKSGLAAKILAASPDGYYRWRCPRPSFDRILSKLQLFRSLENIRPARAQPPRPSLYELRARFASALLVGDRAGAEEIIGQLDLFQLETAVNTQFMRIRMWHRFGEFDRIRNHPDLPHLLAQPLPPRVRAWIDEACGGSAIPVPAAPTPQPPAPEVPTTVVPAEPEAPTPPPLITWIDWFGAVKAGRKEAAEAFLQEQRAEDAQDFSAGRIEALCSCLDEFALDDALRSRERGLILPAVAEILERYVRESGFPRSDLASFYLSLLRLWCLLHRGNSAGREHGHVLLELASALLQLNANVAEVCQTLEEWWKAKPAPSQLYFALDAIELMERELPDPKPAVNLWIEAADVIKRAADVLPIADRELWRRVGVRLGFDEATIAQYLPPEPPEEKAADPLTATGLQHVAIVCLREQQAKQAAEEIKTRSGAKVTVVTATSAGAQTTQASTADVVLFVWLASTHAVFRAFDGFDRQRFCYVQGTGSSSIVRTLERWVTAR
jgi:hypothetical protein